MAKVGTAGILTESPQSQADISALQAEQKRSDISVGAAQEKETAAAKDVTAADTGMQAEGKQLLGQMQPIPQYQPRVMDKNEMMGFAGLAMALSALAARRVGGDVTLALTAAGSAFKGYNEGRIEAARQDIEQFNAKMTSALNSNKMILDRYNAIMADRKLSLQQKIQKYNVAAHEFQDTVAIAAIKEGRIKDLLDRDDKLRMGENQIRAMREQMQFTLDMMDKKLDFQKQLAELKQGPMPSGDTLKAYGAQAASGMPLSQVYPGWGQSGTAARAMIHDEAVKQIMSTTGMDAEMAGAELASRNLSYFGIRGSVSQLEKMYGATQQALGQLEFNVQKTSEAMDKLGGSDLSPVINAIARGEEKWTGDPAYSELFYYMYGAATESSRILSGGQASVAQLHEGARLEAKQWADANWTTPAAWKQGVAPAMISEGKNRLDNFQKAIALQRTRGGAGGAAETVPSFATEKDAERAAATGVIHAGQKIKIGNQTGTWH